MKSELRPDYSGYLGDIWLHDGPARVYWAIQFKPNGEERLIRGIPYKDLNKWLRKLEVPASESGRRALYDNFPSTVLEITERFETRKSRKNRKIKYLKVLRNSV